MNNHRILLFTMGFASAVFIACSNEIVTGDIIDISSDYVVLSGSVDRIPHGNCGIVISVEKEKLDYSSGVWGLDRPTFIDRYSYKDQKVHFTNDSTFQARFDGLYGGVTYYYRAFRTPKFGNKVYYGKTCSFRTPDYSNKAEAVDLALPSGIKWSNVNLGASDPYRPGAQYRWGEVEPIRKDFSSWADYRFDKGENNNEDRPALTKYCREAEYGYNGYTDSLYLLEPIDDAASQLLGESWRTPTKSEWDELMNPSNCTWALEYDESSGDEHPTGYRITSCRNGNSVVLPFEWYGSASYMSSSLGYSGSEWCFALSISGEPFRYDDGSYADTIELEEIIRFSESFVRPVRD